MNLTPDSKVLIQGNAASQALIHAVLNMKAYGTNIVACVSPSQGGGYLQDIPIFDLVEQAQVKVGPVETSIIWVNPYQVLDAALEAIEAGVRQLLIITKGMPPLDMVRLIRKAEVAETIVIGPNCAGIIIPNKLLWGVHPGEFYTPGSIGLIGRGSRLTYEIAFQLTQAKLGQSIGISIGSDLMIGSSFIPWLQILDEDDQTDVIVLVGEVSGHGEEEAASYIAETIDKPVIAYIAGLHLPNSQAMGHSCTLATSKLIAQTMCPPTIDSKISAFKQAKIPLADRPSKIPALVKKCLKNK
ncbi:succinate--CoA ligase subunit alpha [Limnoraphis robusta]|uniref:succinate--CoA ligase subunit alpha n=1 Tax=Limnoraphis robusta TaxID=1118279 RepID=UPI002B1F1F0C|nr:CoA-binding protein [Limnoraphis robusta]MEA5500665.1 CoA-binding protein [Limnoraphis robusta BA-68 BA1]